mmetsp:Transcript_22096/g.72778  ORF Transcript_22096/g.72778 Transcript_22096/m.72778 type:complete len:105 (-) Transcript_22096:64-378(-)
MAPKGFDKVEFVGRCIPNLLLTQTIATAWTRVPPEGLCKKVRVEKIPENSGHPAAGQFGLFAAQTLKPREHVIDYLGYLTSDEEAEESDYLARLAPGLLIDASK